MDIKTPYDYLQATVNGVSLRDAYLAGMGIVAQEVVDFLKSQQIDIKNGAGCMMAKTNLYIAYGLEAKLREAGVLR